MSRLQPLSIPFTRGHTDEIDEKLLPSGVFAEVSNGRLPQVGGLRLRRGWRPVDMSELADNITLSAIDLYSYGDSLVALESGFRMATLVESNSTRPWVLNADARLPTVTNVRKVGGIPSLSSSLTRGSAAVTSNGTYGCVLYQTATQSVVRVFEMATDQTVYFAALANGTRERKVISLGTTFGMVESDGTTLVLFTLTPTATAPSFSSTATLVTTTTVTWWDVAVATDTAPTAVHLAYTDNGATNYAKFSTAGVQSGVAKVITATGSKACSLCCVDDVTVHLLDQLTADSFVRLTTFSATTPFTTIAGPTQVNAQAVVRGLFAVTDIGTIVLVASEHASGSSDLGSCSINAISPETTHAVNQPVGRDYFAGRTRHHR